jgi:hypothetical protein
MEDWIARAINSAKNYIQKNAAVATYRASFKPKVDPMEPLSST